VTETLTIRLLKSLAREFRAKTRAAKTNPTEVLRQAERIMSTMTWRRATPWWNTSALAPEPGMATALVKNCYGGRVRNWFFRPGAGSGAESSPPDE